MKADPEIARNYKLTASSQTWQGQGIRMGTPWLKLDEAKRWHWQADAQLLRLQRFRLIDLSGNVTYQGGNVYDFNLQSQRSNPGITGPFLPPSGSSGLGSSLSVALQGEPATGWRIQLRADDLLSRLQWSELATDTAVLNSQVTSRAPDGSLDYAPLVKGKKGASPHQKPDRRALAGKGQLVCIRVEWRAGRNDIAGRPSRYRVLVGMGQWRRRKKQSSLEP